MDRASDLATSSMEAVLKEPALMVSVVEVSAKEAEVRRLNEEMRAYAAHLNALLAKADHNLRRSLREPRIPEHYYYRPGTPQWRRWRYRS